MIALFLSPIVAPRRGGLAAALIALAVAAPALAKEPPREAPKAEAPKLPATPAARARAIAQKLPVAVNAMRELHKAAAGIVDQPLRAAVETQLLAPWVPPEAWAYGHPREAEALLQKAGLLEGPLTLPKHGVGDFAAAPGGPCDGGHHGYPGGLAVHSWANLLHARALAQTYRTVYGTSFNDDWLVAAALWHDSAKSQTLPFRDDGGCGPETKIAGTPAHHIFGLTAAILRHLPSELVVVIASAHTPPAPEHLREICGWLDAASILADGHPGSVPCPAAEPRQQRAPLEAFVNHFADADFPMTVATWGAYAAKAPAGWARYDAMLAGDANDVAAW